MARGASDTLARLSWDMLVGAPVLLISVILLALRSRIKARLALIHSQIGRLKSDTQLHTPKAVLLNAPVSPCQGHSR